MYKIYAVKYNNGIYYIGQTCKTLHRRKTQHFSNARKIRNKFYNWLNSVDFKVEFEELFEFKTREEADVKEIELIKELKGLKNTAVGGKGGPNLLRSRNGNSKKVLQYNLKGEFLAKFNSLVEAEELTGVKASLISNCITMDRVKSVGGFIWKEFNKSYSKNIEPYFRKNTGNKKNSVSIFQLTKDKKLVKEWSSIREAARELNIFKQGINLCLSEKIKTYKGFIWYRKN